MSEYRIDVSEVKQHQENLALEQYENLVDSCALQPVSFLKKNYEFKKLRERKHEPNITTFLSVTWLKICMLCGIKQNQNGEVWQDITNLVFSYYSDLTIEEIFKAFELERFGEYPERSEHYQFFNSEYVSAVLKKYKVWKQNTKIQHNISRSESVASLPEISESQKNEIIVNGIIRVFNDYKETKIVSEPCNHIFDELLSRGIIKGSTNEKLKAYYDEKVEQAKKELEKELSTDLHTKNYIQRQSLKREIENLIKGNENGKVIARTKKNVLGEFFEKLISENTQIETLLSK